MPILKKNWHESFSKIRNPYLKELEQLKSLLEKMLVGEFEPLDRMLDHLFSAPGKMIRPTLLMMLVDWKKCRREQVISLGAVIELVHTASLVHDDSIDKSTHRRGVPTLNAVWDHKTSVIVGDYLVSQAFREICTHDNIGLVKIVSEACKDLALGEMRQMDMEGDLEATEADYFNFIQLKTASLFSATCRIAALLSGESNLAGYGRLGELFGMIFQITDDLLDYEGSLSDTGKPSRLDIMEHKMTLPVIHVLAAGKLDSVDEDRIRQIMHSSSEVSPEDAEYVAQKVRMAGGTEYTRNRARKYAVEANSLLKSLGSIPNQDNLKNMVDILIERDR